ncbi:hypothetical protein F2P56_002902 [Juglans regia]|uniref:Protein OSB2, chloroplastic-like n=1 Tax=Juglans regia TaxID=51240 RepID=A0A833Y2Z9_JUGRE|nr:hypothetical protein F2P56_002902 [Juglans regia]
MQQALKKSCQFPKSLSLPNGIEPDVSTLLLQPSSLSTTRTTRNFVCIIPKFPFPNLRIPSLAAPSSTNRCLQLRCSVDHKDQQQYSTNTQVAYPKPTEIQWSKELSNTVNIIGIVGTPSGKALAWTRLAVKKSASLTSWINLTFWDELAHISFQHVEKGHQISVSGRLVADIVESEDGKQQTYYKVIVQQLNFVERSLSHPRLCMIMTLIP